MSESNCTLAPIVISGRGVIASIGADIGSFCASLREARGGIASHSHIFADRAIYAGIAAPFAPVDGCAAIAPSGADHTALMASRAAIEALREAGLYVDGKLVGESGRVALLLGTSHGGRSQLDRFVEAGMDETSPDLALGVLVRSTHHYQSAVVASLIGIHGPVTTFSTACSSSGTAIAHGVELLRSGMVDVVVAGGADAFSKLTHAGFSALGATADGPCGPFGNVIGMTLGEGSAFVILETEAHCAGRSGVALARVLGCGTSWDAHHLTAPEPSGHGMSRAITEALRLAGLKAGQIDYISAHATGTRANDLAETLAIKCVCEGIAAPPVSASKSFTGHTLGASSAIGLLVGMAAVDSGVLPPTLNFAHARPGCDLDYVPAQARPHKVAHFLAQSAAFGGANCVIAGGAVALSPAPVAACSASIFISGLGVISPLGSTTERFYAAWRDGQTGFAAADGATATVAGFDPRRQLPAGSSPRIGRIAQLAVAAAEQALNDAGLGTRARSGKNIGLMVGLSRGAVTSFETYMDSVRDGRWERASAIAFPNLVMSSVGGKTAIALNLTGAASTIVGGADVGLALIGHAAEYIRRRSDIDALVVVVADELTPLYLRLQQTLRGAPPALPFAEGAVALVLQRQPQLTASSRLPIEIAGWGQTYDAHIGPQPAPDGHGLAAALQAALRGARLDPSAVDILFGAAADETYARRESAAHHAVFGANIGAVHSLAAQVGVAEASGALFAVAAAIESLGEGGVPATALVSATSEFGNNSAVLFTRHASIGLPC